MPKSFLVTLASPPLIGSVSCGAGFGLETADDVAAGVGVAGWTLGVLTASQPAATQPKIKNVKIINQR